MNFDCKPLANYPLRERNTLGFDVVAQWALPIPQAEQIPVAIRWAKNAGLPHRVLGGGSNVVLPAQLPGLTLLMDIDFIEVLENLAAKTRLRVGAGTNWHAFVRWTLDHSFLGLENLALIPGTVGAAPIQNIGAYGVEVKEYIDTVEAYDCQTNQWVTLSRTDCRFSYRHSVFKDEPNRFVITAVIFDLPKVWQPRISYADLTNYFANRAVDAITAPAIFDAVYAIRTQKLPDPKVIGNVGSFFQNPVISNQQLQSLKGQFPRIVSYPESATHSKLAAGWLIDQCGFKAMQMGNVGVHDKQALVLTHRGGGNAGELLGLAGQIQKKVKETFGVELTVEPMIYSEQ
ncbi:UDP-N-acetylmuramate dehydrogenase [Polynucleobacter sp. HIN8]|uniref:UDP-N-acetylmuramate dehydrogenase n=1 Tax=Polynucleobacter sp. HIN8 TaxID=3047867 RepID=UPI002573E5B1|nr:UDP-N-acetylmuramate dehydrogenase [Polynucleobacter sp. HIN8]BEI38334.1 UDP-N-acetylmuramate dehydrogenase [Polynucleobacter sp. HIN8]